MPFTDDKVIDELERKLSGVSSVTSLLDQGLTPEELLQKLLGDFGWRLRIRFRPPTTATVRESGSSRPSSASEAEISGK